jgi:hypothetical protein
MLAAIVLGALLLRAHDVSRIFLWADETDFFNEGVYHKPPLPLIDFAWSTKAATTNTWGWPAIIWIFCRLFGATIGVARFPSVLVGATAVLAMFYLVYRLLPDNFAGRRFVPAIVAAALAAMAVPQIELSQRTYPYGATPFLSASLLLAHLWLRRVISASQLPTRELVRAVACYTAAGSLCLCIHPSLGLLLAVSVLFLFAAVVRSFASRTRADIQRIFLLGCGAAAVFLGFVLLNGKDPQSGYRFYLHQYYHAMSYRGIVPLIQHAYGLATFQLNLFYNPALYWPDRLNPALLPLVLLCLGGWILAWKGRWGDPARHLAWLGIAAVALPAILSLSKIKIFPFGGLRQTLFLSPFFLVFAALGFDALWTRRATRILAGLVAVAYLALWAYNLPRLYNDRLATYSTADIVNAWEMSGRLPIYAWNSDREIRYAVREHPEIPVETLPYLEKLPTGPNSSYLLVTTRWPLGENNWFHGFLDYFARAGQTATTLIEKQPRLPQGIECRCIYFPPSGLYLYKVAAR